MMQAPAQWSSQINCPVYIMLIITWYRHFNIPYVFSVQNSGNGRWLRQTSCYFNFRSRLNEESWVSYCTVHSKWYHTQKCTSAVSAGARWKCWVYNDHKFCINIAQSLHIPKLAWKGGRPGHYTNSKMHSIISEVFTKAMVKQHNETSNRSGYNLIIQPMSWHLCISCLLAYISEAHTMWNKFGGSTWAPYCCQHFVVSTNCNHDLS